jgi:hypothetical protein
MLQDLVLAIGIPLLLLLLAVLALERWADQLPPWLQHLSQRPSVLWNTGIGLIIGLSERTVNFHLFNACRKLNVYGRQAGVAQALRLGLLTGHPHLSRSERTNSSAFSFESDCFGPETTT